MPNSKDLNHEPKIKRGNSLADKVRDLTERQRQCLDGILKGKSNLQIAQDLGVNEKTIKYHVTLLYRKIGAVNRMSLALLFSKGMKSYTTENDAQDKSALPKALE